MAAVQPCHVNCAHLHVECGPTFLAGLQAERKSQGGSMQCRGIRHCKDDGWVETQRFREAVPRVGERGMIRRVSRAGKVVAGDFLCPPHRIGCSYLQRGEGDHSSIHVI